MPEGFVPLPSTVEAAIRPPGSKSLTIRALAIAALADGRSHLYGALEAHDTAVMAGALRLLGAAIESESEPWIVHGTKGELRPTAAPLDAGESGLSARICLALAALVDGEITITGEGRLVERPMSPLLAALAAGGVRHVSDSGTLPITLTGLGRVSSGAVTVDCSLSSQFGTALLITAPMADGPVRLRLDGLTGSWGYLDLTTSVMAGFGASAEATLTGYEVAPTGYRSCDYVIEPDASAAVYPIVAAAITGSTVQVVSLDRGSKQPDVSILDALAGMGCEVGETGQGLMLTGPDGPLSPIDANLAGSPDGALALAVACLFASGESRINGLGSLRHKESDRLEAMSTEITRLGGNAIVDGDGLLISPGDLHGGTVDPHGDHRIAMSLALVGLRVQGVEVADSGVVAKTWPGYWHDMRSAFFPN